MQARVSSDKASTRHYTASPFNKSGPLHAVCKMGLDAATVSSDRHPLLPLPSNTCPFRPATAPQAQQPSESQTRPAAGARCPFAAALPQENMPQPAQQHSPCNQQPACPEPQGAKKTAAPAVHAELQKPTASADLYCSDDNNAHLCPVPVASGVDLAAMAAEMAAYEDTFATHPDEALLHAYATLLAEKVAEAGTAPFSSSGQAAESAQTLGQSAATETGALRNLAAACGSKEWQLRAEADLGASSGPSWHVTKPTEQQFNAKADSDHAVILAELPAAVLSQLQSKREADRLGMSPSVEASPSVADQHDQQLLDGDFHAYTEIQQEQEDNATRQKQTQAADAVHTSVWRALQQLCRCCWRGVGQQSVAWHIMMVVIFGVQLALAAYFGLVHQR